MRRHFLGLALSAAALSLAACGETAAPVQSTAVEENSGPADVAASAEDTLYALVEGHAAHVMRFSPEFATFLGVSEDVGGAGYNGRLGRYGFEGNLAAQEMNLSFLQDIRGIERSDLSGDALVTFDIIRGAYETATRRNQFDFGGAPVFGSSSPYVVSQLSGPHLFLPRLLQTQNPMATREDAQAYLDRLSEFGRVFDEVAESLGSDAALGITPPHFAIEGAVASMAQFTNPAPEDNPLVRTFTDKASQVAALSPDEVAQMSKSAAELVDNVVYPAFARLSVALENLAPQAGSDAGVWRLGEEGEAYYQHALDYYGAGGKTGDEIHALGLVEVERITGEMDAILRAEGLTEGSVADRFDALGRRPDLIYPDTDEGRAALLDDIRVFVSEVMEASPQYFATMPTQALEVRRMPVYEQDSSSSAYYTGPSLDGTMPGIYWINLKDISIWPKHTLKTLTYHEAAPGHHFQISLSRGADLPLLRNMLGYSEYTEGWALYAEAFAVEMGLYDDDPLGNLGRLQAEIFRAARLVVDTGLNAKQWTREEAIDYLVSVTGKSPSVAKREIERYAVRPAQAVSYKLGMLKIQELRSLAEDELGEAFDIRAFHDAILMQGSMPLTVLDAKIKRWIEAQKNNEGNLGANQ
ncbi:MAG: DUF885 domain-containing protein [Pseudomonadota bacterium]